MKEKGKGGALLYLMNIFSSLVNYKYANAVISVDGTDLEHEFLSMNVGICKYNGGGMIAVPGAVPDDGLFDLTVINRMSSRNGQVRMMTSAITIRKNMGKILKKAARPTPGPPP